MRVTLAANGVDQQNLPAPLRVPRPGAVTTASEDVLSLDEWHDFFDGR